MGQRSSVTIGRSNGSVRSSNSSSSSSSDVRSLGIRSKKMSGSRRCSIALLHSTSFCPLQDITPPQTTTQQSQKRQQPHDRLRSQQHQQQRSSSRQSLQTRPSVSAKDRMIMGIKRVAFITRVISMLGSRDRKQVEMAAEVLLGVCSYDHCTPWNVLCCVFVEL